nr:cyclin-dependent kinase-like 2 [Cryptomonas curvata]
MNLLFIYRKNLRKINKIFFYLFFKNENKNFFFKNSSFYQKIGLIDIGTYGKVFKVKKIKNKKIYACKEIQKVYNSNFFCSSLIKEINFLFSIIHPNIIFIKEAIFNIFYSKIFIISEYCEYDLKSLLESQVKFSSCQIKFILRQLLLGTNILHENKIVHRDIKTSNILLTNKGIIKICDFGLVRSFTKEDSVLTQGVVTLWYRAPEVLIGLKNYTTAIDIWAVGCVFAELVLNEVLLPGRSELDQLNRIFSLLGTPNLCLWENFDHLCKLNKINFPVQSFNNLSKRFRNQLNIFGIDLLNRFFTYDPLKRITAKAALKHPYFAS